MTRSVPHGIVERICSNFDPFCQAAMGAKLFDENTIPSMTYTSRQIFPITLDANGVALVWFNNSYRNYFMTATIVAGTVTGWTATDSDAYSSLTTAMSRWRVVSTGLKYFTTQAWTSASGYINISEITEPYNSANLPVANSLRLGPRVTSVPLRDAKFVMIGRGKGMQTRTYKVPDDIESGYSGTMLYFNGAANTLVGYVEAITNFEWIPDAYTSYQLYTTPAAPHVPMIMDAVGDLSSKGINLKQITDSVNQAADFMSAAKQSAHKVSGIVDDVSAIGGMFYPPLRGINGVSNAIHALTG